MLISCKENENKLMNNPDKWAPVLADMQIIQSMLENTHPETKDSLSAIYVEQLLKIHDIKKEDIEQLKEELVRDPNATAEFYEKVTLYFQNIETTYEEKIPPKIKPSENQE
jgi:hypothetical protein